MIPDLQSGRMVFGRFRLSEALGKTIWRAKDTQLERTQILAFYTIESGAGVHERLLKLRDVRHDSLARMEEVYLDEEYGAVALANVDGRPLADHLEAAGAMPYLNVLDAIEPVVRGLQAVHQAGLVHGELSPDRILIDGDSRLLLLPPSQPTESANDVHSLGKLMRSALTGARPLADDRELNDVPDLLHEGRTLPALLNQLVSDMCSTHAGQRPAGTGEVLRRLEQIEKVIEEPAEIPVIADLDPVPSVPSPPKSNDWIKWVISFVVLLVLAGAIGGIGFGFLYFKKIQDEAMQEAIKQQQAAEQAMADKEADAQQAEAEPEVDLVKLALQKAEAEDALDQYLRAKKDAETVGAHRWAEEKFTDRMRGAAIADQAYLDKDFPKAAEKYREVALGLDRLKEGKEQALIELLLQGVDELESGTSASATRVFETALLIDPSNAEAQTGLKRAPTLDELNDLLANGGAREKQKQWAFAHTDFAEAVALDPLSEEAKSGLERVKTAIAEEKFQTMMSAGLMAYEKGDYDLARAKLQEAKDFRPDRKEVDDAMEMVAEGIRLRTIKELQVNAGKAEAGEDWQGARAAYLRVLEIDENIAFAQEGKQRTEKRIALMTHLAHYLARPALLTTPQGREAVNLVISDAEALKDKGPRLKQAYEDLAKLVTKANTKINVMIASDNRTEVTVYKVGKFGALTSKALALLPGTYTVLGQRDGYKDVRHTLKLEPGQTEARLEVICTEQF